MSEISEQTLASISTPEAVETRIGTLRFRDGIPDAGTCEKVYDQLDLSHGIQAYLAGLAGVSMYAWRKGQLDAGVADNSVMIYTGLMDSETLLLTGNADTVYFFTFLDLSQGPVALQVPPECLGAVNDMWFRWVTDVGVPGPDRGAGGTYLLVPPGYTGPLPEGGMFVAHCQTVHVCMFARSFLRDGDPAPAVAQIKENLRISPYTPGGKGSSVASFLRGKGPLGAPAEPPAAPVFVEGTGVAVNTVPPNDYSFYEFLDALVQDEPVDAVDPEGAGSFRAIGIVKGQDFKPDARLRALLEEAVAIGNATGRTLGFRARREEGFAYYEGSGWYNPLFIGGYDWTVPPPQVTATGLEPYPPTTGRALNSRTAFFYLAIGVTPAMCMRLPGVGSQYLVAALDSSGEPVDGGRSYQVTLPAGIPAARFWSLTLYDNQTRSMLQTPQRYPRAGSQDYPSPAAAANSDGSTTIHFAPARPDGVAEGNWIQTLPGKGWFACLRLYSPEQPFFDRSWRLTEITPTAR